MYRPYQCRFCKIYFNSFDRLNLHVRRHRAQFCGHCVKQTGISVALKRIVQLKRPVTRHRTQLRKLFMKQRTSTSFTPITIPERNEVLDLSLKSTKIQANNQRIAMSGSKKDFSSTSTSVVAKEISTHEKILDLSYKTAKVQAGHIEFTGEEEEVLLIKSKATPRKDEANQTSNTSTAPEIFLTDHWLSNLSYETDKLQAKDRKIALEDSGSRFNTKCESIDFRCKFCPKIFQCKSHFDRHVMVHTKEKPFVCNYCHKGFTQKGNRDIHTRIHTKERPFHCEICSKTFSHRGNLTRHIQTHFKNEPSPDNSNELQNILNSTKFSFAEFLTECQKIIDDKRIVLNKQCVKPLEDTSCLKDLASMVYCDGKEQYRCTYCNKEFLTECQLKRHTLLHTNEKQHKCGICAGRFSRRYDLKVHLRVHTNIKPYNCEYCQKRFAQKSALNNHIRVHTKEKPYGCTYCTKRFTQRANLKTHMNIHLKLRPYICDYCNRGFTQRSNLLRHVNRVHFL